MRAIIGILITLIFIYLPLGAQKAESKIRKIAEKQIKNIMWNNQETI